MQRFNKEWGETPKSGSENTKEALGFPLWGEEV